MRIDTTAHRTGHGLYRWPTSWSATWGGPDAGHAKLHTVTRTVVGQYGIVGFGMSIVAGLWITPEGTSRQLYGFGELLAAGPALRSLARRR